MSVEAKTAILEHLGRQHQAMVGILADLVNIDSGSYNKRGVDAVGDRLRVFLEAAAIPCETFPNDLELSPNLGDGLRVQVATVWD